MKYRSISLNDNKDYVYSLVRYDESKKSDLEFLKDLDKGLVDSVKFRSEIYDELSNSQSYMLYRDIWPIGIVCIDISKDNKTLEIRMELDEDKMTILENRFDIVEKVVDSLGLFFYNQKNIEVIILNDIDLSLCNKKKYKKRVYNKNLVTYTCSNIKNNRLYTGLTDEIRSAEAELCDLNLSWSEKIDRDYSQMDFNIDKELISEYDNAKVLYSEIFNKINELNWNDIKSKKSVRNISFSSNGQIKLGKSSLKNYDNSYIFKYNLLRYGFVFVTNGFDGKKLEVDENCLYTKIKSDNLVITTLKESGEKIIDYLISNDKDSSIGIRVISNNDIIDKCYIDFNTHKQDKKKSVNGQYLLRLVPDNNIYRLFFVSRDGNRGGNLLNKDSDEIVSIAKSGIITFEMVDDLIKKIIPVINNYARMYGKQTISEFNGKFISDSLVLEQDVINYVKHLKSEVPLPALRESIDDFVKENGMQNNVIKYKNRIRSKD